MAKKTLVFGGDMYVGFESEKYFKSVNQILDNADIRMFQLEKPYMKTPVEGASEDRYVKVLDPIIGKVDLVTLAGNHFYDFGEVGVRETIEWCHENGIECCGGGSNIVEANKPAYFEKDGVKVGVIAVNVVGPKHSFAGPNKGGTGCINFTRAWVAEEERDQSDNKFEFDVHQLEKDVQKEGKFDSVNFVDPEAYVEYADMVTEAKKNCDILIAYFHKGYVHKETILAPYERLLSRIAIDAGADMVCASHSHILHGIEMYKGKAIYHGLGNFVIWAPYLSGKYTGKVSNTADMNYTEWAAKREKRFGFVADPDYPTYPFLKNSVNCMTAKLIIEDKKIVEYRLIPMRVEKDGIPYVHGNDEVGREVVAYIEQITKGAGLNAKFRWDGDEVVISE